MVMMMAIQYWGRITLLLPGISHASALLLSFFCVTEVYCLTGGVMCTTLTLKLTEQQGKKNECKFDLNDDVEIHRYMRTKMWLSLLYFGVFGKKAHSLVLSPSRSELIGKPSGLQFSP